MSKHYPRPRNEMTEEERLRWRMDTKTDKSGGSDACWLWFGATSSNGYAHLHGVTLYGETKTFPYGHRTAWALANGRWPVVGEVVMHDCDNPPCVNPEHLTIGTQMQNIADRPRSGRWFGMGHGKGKLTPEQVRWARTNGLSQVETSKTLEVSQVAISNLRARKTYKHVE